MVIVPLFSLLVAGCPRFPTASEGYTKKARQFSPPPGRAGLYVMRTAQFVAAGSPINVFLDHKKFGSLPPPSFIYAEILPREHVLELAEVSGCKNISIRFTAEEKKCYFYLAEVHMGFGKGTMTLEPLSEEEGRELVNKYEQSKINAFDYKDEILTPQ